ncbi:DL-glycerol-3-phosphatase [Friedmanniomyces endolithicus]|nr:DL-glycerol-3-phosphatase [Friedmanniomyces endolithicus]
MSSTPLEPALPSHSSSTNNMKEVSLPPPPNFSAPPSTHSFAALLFDMDGTLIDSTPAIIKHWHALGTLIGVPGPIILETSHGRRTIDVLALLAPQPRVLVCAEEVGEGKPSPEGYRLGARRLGFGDGSAGRNGEGKGGAGALREVRPEEILVLEDAPAGVRAGKAAGYRVVALATTHTIEQLREAGADWIVEDMRSVTMTDWDAKTERVGIQITNALVS